MTALGDVQQCLGRLYTESAFRKSFFRDPSAALAGFGLPPRQAQALAALDRGEVERFAATLVGKARERFEAAYPLSWRVAGPTLSRLYESFHAARPLQEERGINDRLLTFGAHARDALAVDPDVPSFTAELMGYERQTLCARLHSDPAASGPALHDDASLDRRPHLAPGATIETYVHDMPALAHAVAEGDPLAAAAASPLILLVHPVPGRARPQMVGLNAAIARLLALCDGRRTLRASIDLLGAELDRDDVAGFAVARVGAMIEGGALHG